MVSNEAVIKLRVGGVPLRALDAALRCGTALCSEALAGARGQYAASEAGSILKSDSFQPSVFSEMMGLHNALRMVCGLAETKS